MEPSPQTIRAATGSEPLRVLHVSSILDPAAGGIAVAVIALAEAQHRAGANVSVVATYSKPEDRPAERLRAQGIHTEQVGPCKPPLWRHPQIVPTLRRLIPQADIVHIHALWEEVQYQAARLCRKFGVPYVITPHGMLDPWSLSQGALKKKLYLALRMRRNLDAAAAIHFTTDTERDLVKPLKLRPPAIVEPNGVDLAEFEDLPPRGTFRARFPQLGDRPAPIFLGRLNYKKGFDLLIPAFARTQISKDTILVIAGPDAENYRATIERMMSEHGVAPERVIFTGMLRGRERVEALVDADLFVLPSYQENFGIAVVEALAAGTPVLISDQVNIHGEISAAAVGAVVPTQVEPLARELSRWLNDPAIRRDASQRAIPFVRERYDWNQIARRWIEHYRRLAASKARDFS
jgi:glycosyltransferase involved in cell wall biosynthesis